MPLHEGSMFMDSVESLHGSDGASASNVLATSSILRSPGETEHSTTEEEWHSVGRLLTGIRMETLKSSPVALKRYAKQTTDTDLWTWKQTADWGNRRAIKRYLQRQENLRKPYSTETRPKSAPRRRTQKRGIRLKSGVDSADSSSSKRAQRPSTAHILRSHSHQGVKHENDVPKATKRITELHELSQEVDAKRHSNAFRNQALIVGNGADWVYNLALGKHVGSRPMIRNEWPKGLQSDAKVSSRPRYRISRRRKDSFAKVTVRDKLILERVAKASLLRAARQNSAKLHVPSVNHAKSGGALW